MTDRIEIKKQDLNDDNLSSVYVEEPIGRVGRGYIKSGYDYEQERAYVTSGSKEFTNVKYGKITQYTRKDDLSDDNSTEKTLNVKFDESKNEFIQKRSRRESKLDLIVRNALQTNKRKESSSLGFKPFELAQEIHGTWSKIIIIVSYFFLVIFFPFSIFACVKVAQEYERAVVFRLGRILHGGEKGPGIFFILPCIDTYVIVDLRTVTFDVPPQEILTKDSVTVSVDAVVYFRIFNAVTSVVNVEDAAKSTKLLAATTLRNVLGTKSLHEILSDRETVATLIQNSLLIATSSWGVQVERVEVKDVRLPIQLQRAMATEAEAAREARAKVIAAEGEKKASFALREAAITISRSPIAIQLRYLQTLIQIASERNSTIVFPIPIEFMRKLMISNKSCEKKLIKNEDHNQSQVLVL